MPQEKRRELTSEKTELKVILNKNLVQQLDKIKALMSHKNSNMTDQELIEVMAKLVLEKIDPMEKAKRSEAKNRLEPKPKNHNATLVPPSEVNTTSRYIPATMKQGIYIRDKGKCTHPDCDSTHFLEYDHIKPFALGGKATLDNLRLLCRAHNQRAAIDKFGFHKMQKFMKT